MRKHSNTPLRVRDTSPYTEHSKTSSGLRDTPANHLQAPREHLLMELNEA
jgi:hypothetical protein